MASRVEVVLAGSFRQGLARWLEEVPVGTAARCLVGGFGGLVIGVAVRVQPAGRLGGNGRGDAETLGFRRHVCEQGRNSGWYETNQDN
jgi:hypothetical protein